GRVSLGPASGRRRVGYPAPPQAPAPGAAFVPDVRTTLKRGLGQTGSNGNGKAVFPPGAVTPMTRYRQPPPPRPGRIRQILAWGFASMLLPHDPPTKSLSLLSFPRALVVNRICPGHVPVQDRINSAYEVCGPKGTVETVKNLTGLPINYLISVNFHGFKDIVNRVGGVWMDIDRRYYNKNVGTAGTNYADIDLHPGYQRLNGAQALEYVRYRHFDSDIYRTARQQLFLAALH